MPSVRKAGVTEALLVTAALLVVGVAFYLLARAA